MAIKSPGKKIKEHLALLGDPYEITIIDLENVIRRSINETYDIEISGLDNQKKKFHSHLYVWKNKSRIVETISDITSFGELQKNLTEIDEKYSFLKP